MHEHINHHHIPAALALATLVVVGVALHAPGGHVGANATSSSSSHQLQTEYEQQPATVGTPVCSPATSCVVPFSLVGVATGDMEGTSAQAGAASRLPDGSLYANSTVMFTGTVTGCGSGTVTMRSTGFNRAGATTGIIEIIEGSGTGGLASLTGTGNVISGTVDPATGVGRGAVEWKIKC